MNPNDRLGYLLFMLKSLSPTAAVLVMEMINSNRIAGADRFNTLKHGDKALTLSIHSLLMDDETKANKIMHALDTVESELYALLNEEKPTD